MRYAPQINEFGRLITVLIVGIVGFLFVVRPLLRASGLSARAPAQAQLVEVTAAAHRRRPGERDRGADGRAGRGEGGENRRLPVLTRRVSALTKKEPEQVAKLLRGWIREAER